MLDWRERSGGDWSARLRSAVRRSFVRSRTVRRSRHFEGAAVQSVSPCFRRRGSVYGKTGLAAITTMRSRGSIGAGRGRTGRALSSDGPLALLHIRAAVALVSRDRARTLGTGRGVGKSASSLQLSKDGILVCKQIAHKAVAISLVHAQTRLLARTKDAWRKCGCKSSDKRFIRRS
jgi:hypothetical protein